MKRYKYFLIYFINILSMIYLSLAADNPEGNAVTGIVNVEAQS
ncbi:MAG: hypothetical protein ORN26_02735 [Candidatus Pacebacteria bacterium]|nr:hypothetical protein [Candidatus Paceibacterota bacterium]